MRKARKPATYRVDLVISTGGYAPYTSREGTDLGMARSLAAGIKKQSTGGRIVELPSGVVLEEWSFDTVQKSPNALRDAVQALRDKPTEP
jgi:hypothetical protein